MLSNYKIWPLAGILFLFSLQSFCQDAITGNLRFTARFLSDSLELQPGKYAFNSIQISNHSDQPVQLKLELNIPAGWLVMNELPASVQLQAGENRTLSVRVRSGEGAIGGKNYTYLLKLQDVLTGQVLLKRVSVGLKLSSDWNASLEEYVKYSGDDEPLPDFKFKLSNQGNRMELYELEFESEFRLTVPQTGTQILLRPGRDTLITVGIRSRTLNQTQGEVKLQIKSRNGIKTLQQKIFFVSAEHKEHENDRYILPINFRWRGMSLSGEWRPAYVLEADGSLQLENNRYLTFHSRSYLLDNRINFNSSIHRVLYQGKNSVIEVGSLQDFVFAAVNGYGARVGFRNKRNSLEVAAVSPVIYRGSNYVVKHNAGLGKRSEIQTEALLVKNGESGVTSTLSTHEYKWRSVNTGNFSIIAGYSSEQAAAIGNWFKGYMYGYQTYLNNRFVTLASVLKYNSSWFPGVNRGLTYHNHDLALRLGKMKVGAYALLSSRQPNIYDTEFRNYQKMLFQNNRDLGFQAGVKGFRLRAGTYSLLQLSGNGSGAPQQMDNPEVRGLKASFNGFFKVFSMDQFVQIEMMNMGFDSESTLSRRFSTYNLMLSGTFKSFGYNFRYNHGPVYYLDYLYYSRTGTWQNRHQYAIFYASPASKNLRGRASLNYFSSHGFGSRELIAQSDLEYEIPSRGLMFSFGNTVNLLRRGDNPYFTVSVSKLLNVPVPFFRKYRSMRVRMFKDANNNNSWDIGEEAVKGATISVDGKYLRSDETGLGKLRNAERKSYVLNFSHITNQVGWMPEKLLSDSINLKKDMEVLIPFKSTKVISGQLFYESSDYSVKRSVNLGGLRILAIDGQGNQTEAITTDEGLFYFNLFPGVYTIQMPVDAAGSKLSFPVSEKKVDLTHSESEHVNFILKDKGRVLNIRKASE